MPKYVISSAEFETLKAATKQLAEWEDNKTLCPNAKVYRIDKEYKPMWKPVLVEWGKEK